MRNNLYQALIAAAALSALAACEKENSFLLNPDQGQLNCDALSVDYINNGTRSGSVDVNEFEVRFVNTSTNETVKTYTYAEMPEIVSLPVGKYRAIALYGDNTLEAEWENPYYRGSSTFSIEAGKITDEVEPIECSLQNMKVEVEVIDETGFDVVGEDVQVIVRAGSTGELTYDHDHLDQAGYFKYEENSTTIVADFSGTIDGLFTDGIRRIYDNAAPGNSYKIHFTINRPDNMNPGDIQPGDEIVIDATITVTDETKEVDPNEPDHEIIIDDMRPVDGSGSGDDNPGDDDNPGTDPGDTNGPTIISTAEGMVLGEPYEVTDGSKVTFSVTSETGITGFTIKIDSPTLDAETLEGVGLSAELDLVNPGEFEESLNNLGFPTGDDVKGQTSIDFDISQFVPLLGMLGSGEHKFILTVTDDNGTTTATVWLKN